MFWLILAAVLAAGAVLGWIHADAGAAALAAGAAAVWVGARLAARALGGGPGAPGGSAADGAEGGAAWQEAVAARAAELEMAPDAPAVAAWAEALVAESVPGASVDLWLTTDRGTWRRPQGTAVREAPEVAAVEARLLRDAAGAPAATALAAEGGALAALAEVASGRWLVPLARADRLLGILFADGPEAVRELALAMRPALAEALGHARMVRRLAQQREVAAEVELAAAVQQAFIPDGQPHAIGPIEVAGSYVPASECGGDWWAVHDMGDGRALLLVADVTGHGIGAARITAAARGAYDVAVQLGGGRPELAALMHALDAAVRRVGAGHYHMTCFAAVIDSGRRVSFTSAGHVPPYLCRAPDSSGRVAIDALVARGNPLGVARPLSVSVSEQTLRPADLLVFYSDGLLDCTSPRGERLGDRRMQRLLRELAGQDLEIGAVRDRIEAMVREHSGGSPQADDITFVAARVL